MKRINILNLKVSKQYGITLIALVITIIVLLILAGVTISVLAGDNGLLTKASDVKQSSKEAEIREKIQLAVIAAKTNSTVKLEEALEEELIKEFGTDNYEIIVVGQGYIIIVDNIQYRIEENGTVQKENQSNEANSIENAGDLSKGGQYDGLTEETSYRISCIEDLVEWTNKYIKLEKTIDFNSVASYNNYKLKTTDINENGKIEELITELTTGIGFKPIADFSSTFDGQNNEIRNIYEDRIGEAGLFGTANSAIIKNLGVTGKIKTTGCVGGIAASGSNLQINNCYNKATIFTTQSKSSYYSVGAGGIIGYGGTNTTLKINNCYNFGNIESRTASGGLMGSCIGSTKPEFYNSSNLGNIKGKYAGGISGSNGEKIINCYNLGTIEGSEHARRIKRKQSNFS